jgi:excisionase family DNA binding protein
MSHAQRMIRSHDLTDRAVRSPKAAEPQSLSPQELAAEWGCHVDTVYRDIRKRALRAYRLPGGSLRIRREDADRYGRPLW